MRVSGWASERESEYKSGCLDELMVLSVTCERVTASDLNSCVKIDWL